jgi:ParB-like chromosome segregation protein Spo0J
MQRFFLLLKEVQVKIAMRPLAQLVPYARNARTHSDAQIAQIAASIAEFGFTNPVLADEKGIVAGHGRVLAVRQLFEAGRNVVGADGREVPAGKVPVIDCTGWSESQRRAYVIADNKLALNAGWDLELLSLELRDLDGLFDLGLTGFAEDELADLLGLVGDADLPGLADGDREPFQQMTFVLHDDQARQVEAAIAASKAQGPFIDTENENSNGNALARMAVAFLKAQADA